VSGLPARRLRVLYVAFYFPPAAGGAVERTLRFLAYLPDAGVDAEVLTAEDAKWLADDPAALARVPPGLRVHRVPYRGPGNRVAPSARLARATTPLARLTTRARLLPRRLLVPDVDVPWLVDVVPAARRLLASGRFDALVTTSPPHSVTLAGALIARGRPEPWIGDWRDPWLDHPDLDLERRSVRAKTALAARLAAHAGRRLDAAACVDDGIAAEVRRLAPRATVAVIPNGAEVEQIAALERHPAVPGPTLLHAGYFFGDRSPRTLLDGLALLLRERPAAAGTLRVRFVGGVPDADRAAIHALGLGDVVSLEPTRPHAEVLQAERDADALLLFMQDKGPRSAPFVPQKTWEYLAAERPVLALVPPDGAAASELRAAGAGEVVAPGDAAGACAALGRVLDRHAAGTLAVPGLDAATRRRISRRGRAEAFAALIRGAVERGAAGRG
jgi:hypothetical protein